LSEEKPMSQANSIVHDMMIEADNATVFAFFTDPERLIRWIGVSASLEPKPGGLLLIDVQNGHKARGEFKEVVPVSHLAYTWGWEGTETVPPGSSLIEINLSSQDGHTLLRFTHSGLPPEEVERHTESWNHYLVRLAMAASGKNPGPDPRMTRMQ
jgi:uncharacterized protein YndB with AHSA1/START domain